MLYQHKEENEDLEMSFHKKKIASLKCYFGGRCFPLRKWYLNLFSHYLKQQALPLSFINDLSKRFAKNLQFPAISFTHWIIWAAR